MTKCLTCRGNGINEKEAEGLEVSWSACAVPIRYLHQCDDKCKAVVHMPTDYMITLQMTAIHMNAAGKRIPINCFVVYKVTDNYCAI